MHITILRKDIGDFHLWNADFRLTGMVISNGRTGDGFHSGILNIIDYEFAGYNDPGYDFGRVIAGFEYEADEPKILDILEAYFGRPATEMEHRHWMAYSTIHNWYYVGWALYKESINEYTLMWANEIFDGKHPDTFGEPV